MDLKLAIEGTIIMSEDLKDALDNMFDARVPNSWRKISWEASTLGFWFSELQDRDTQFRAWCFEGRPKSFWMTGFFNPQVAFSEILVAFFGDLCNNFEALYSVIEGMFRAS